MILETERLILRELTNEDLPSLRSFLQDSEVMYAYEGAFSDEEVENWLAWNQSLYQSDGYGLWALVRKEDQTVIGECGLTKQIVEEETYLEIGYHLIKDAWHEGYAIEAATAVKYYAFEILQAPEVISVIRDTNLPSMNVAIRNGMTAKKRFIKHYRGHTMPHFLFSVKNSNKHQ